MNSLFRIIARKKLGVWVFDDAKRGLVEEPFVPSAGAILDALSAHIPGAAEGISILFSDEFFPGYKALLCRDRPEGDGHWYELYGLGEQPSGWLCPALLKFFTNAPDNIYLVVM